MNTGCHLFFFKGHILWWHFAKATFFLKRFWLHWLLCSTLKYSGFDNMSKHVPQCTHTHIHVHICTHFLFAYTCILYTHIHTHTHPHTHTHKYSAFSSHVHPHTHSHTHMNTLVCSYVIVHVQRCYGVDGCWNVSMCACAIICGNVWE
jgi:hypothetical protein